MTGGDSTQNGPTRTLSILDTLSRWFSETLAWLAAVGTVGAMVVLLIDITLRTVTGSSMAGAYETVQASVVLITFFALPYCERSGQSVRVNILTEALKPRPALLLRQFGRLAALVIAGWLAYATGLSALDSIDRGEYTTGLIDFPVWPVKAAIAIGFIALCLELACQALRGLLDLTQLGDTTDENPDDHAAADELTAVKGH